MPISTTADRLQEALALHRRGAVADASAIYSEVLRSDPSNADAHYYLAMIACQHGRFVEGAAFARKSVASDARHERAHVLLGRALAALGQNEEALQNFERAIALAPDLAQAHSHLADALSELGRHTEAVDSYDRALALAPDCIEDWFNRGLALSAVGRHSEAIASFDRVVADKPEFVQAHLQRANALSELERHADALASVDQALASEPELAEAYFTRGNVLRDLARHDQAFAAYSKALTLKPALAGAWLGRGNVHADLRQHDDAFAAFDEALQLKPDLAEAWLGRGNLLYDLERYDEALTAYAKALALQPDFASAWLGHGNIYLALKRYSDAATAFDRALALKPNLAEAWLGRGNLSYELRHYTEALAAYDKALAFKPKLAEAHLGRGNVANHRDQANVAVDAYDKALGLKPELAEAWIGLGYMLIKLDRRSDGLAAMDGALALKPDFAEAWAGRGRALFEMNRVTEAFAALDRALAIKPDLAEAIASRIFALDFADDAGFERQQQARHYWWQHVGAAIAAKSRIEHRNARDPERRIKLGYVSSDLREHSAARCFRPMMRNHDKSQFEITCYSSSPLEDEVTQEFRQVADCWQGVAQLSDDELCAQIQADEIDILVDLSGYTAGHRLGVFARKPAPLQVSAGATGTGLPTVDYLFSDPVVCPQAVRHLFAEKIFDLPSIMTIEALPAQLRPSDPPVLSKGHITFGVFNRANKISDDGVALWARILQAVPAAQLLMKHYAFDEAATRSRQLERFAAHGIAADRIAFLGATARDAHLAALREVDISLDPFPQNGGISTLESLQMGVPVVALLGNSISSRAAGAILSCAGLGDWVADTAEEYLAIAVKFAAMPDHLKSLRYELPARIAASAVGNSAIYTKAVETAYRTMWQDYCRATIGQPLTA